MSRTAFGLRAALLSLFVSGCASAPPFQGWEDPRLYAYAQERYAEEDYEEAIKALNRLLLSSTSDLAAEARFLLAESYYGDEDYLTASSEYQRFQSLHGTHPLAPRAALGNCRAYAALSPHPQRDQTYTEQAIGACRNVATDYQGLDVATEANAIVERMRAKLAEKLYAIGEHYMERKFWDSAIIYHEQILTQYPDSQWAPRALLRLVNAYQEIGYEDLVAEYRQRLLTEYPDSPEARSLANGG